MLQSVSSQRVTASPQNRQNLLKTVVAFANGAGGNIYVGVNDDRTVAGIKDL